MVFAASLRAVATKPASALRVATPARATVMAPRAVVAPSMMMARRTYASHSHDDESFESFTTRYVSFFTSVEDLFELQRGLNNCFAYDLVPAPEVVEAALKAARRVNDYSTAVRVFEGIKEKVENKRQYEQYVEALEGVRRELGITLREELYEGSA